MKSARCIFRWVPRVCPRALRRPHTVCGLRQHYPELANENLVPVDIIDDGEKLATFKDRSQEFVIANHFLEHASRIRLEPSDGLLQVLRLQGILYLAVPDKRFTFDAERPLTTA